MLIVGIHFVFLAFVLKKAHCILLLMLAFATVSSAQTGNNYPQFDYKKIHFGFALGANTSDFHYAINPDSTSKDSITGITIRKQPGFNLGIVSSWDIHETFHIRFIPSLAFQERLFSYTYLFKGEQKLRETRIESTTLDFPLLIKLRTKRIGNFAAYAITGMQYSLDLASQADVDQSLGDPIVKIKKHDYAYQVGGGFDFWMEYFKLGIELKLSNGIRNLVINDGTFFMSPLSSLKSKVWWFSITFEG